jgi:hypothetical protein
MILVESTRDRCEVRDVSNFNDQMAQQDQAHVHRRWTRFERFMCRLQVVMRDHASGADMSVVHIFIFATLVAGKPSQDFGGACE